MLIHTNRIRVGLDGQKQPAKKRIISEGWVFDDLLKDFEDYMP